jgi:hypothetical protein
VVQVRFDQATNGWKIQGSGISMTDAVDLLRVSTV